MRQKRWLFILSLGLLAAMTACGSSPTGATSAPCTMPKGQDSQPAVEVTLQATCSLQGDGTCTHDELGHLSTVRALLGQRLICGLGVSNPSVRQEGTDRILMDFPALRNEQEAIDRLTQTGQMMIIDTGSTALSVGQSVPAGSNYPTASADDVQFTSAQLDAGSVNATIDPQTGQPVLVFQFKGAAQSAFADYTGTHIGQYLTITLDNDVIESAVIESKITGQVEIAGGTMTLASAQEIAAVLRSGPLPTPLTRVNERSLSVAMEPPFITESPVANE